MKQYLVGGAVRSIIIDGSAEHAKDLDYVVVGSSVQEMESRGLIQVGAFFPVFMTLEPADARQWALARRERKVAPGYQGFDVDTTGVTLEEDLLRRDLTCNAVAFDEETNTFIDPYGGIEDLKNGVLRPVSESFCEDPLRALRVVRFYCTKDWAKVIHPDAIRMIHQIVDSGEFASLHANRVYEELSRILHEITVSWDEFFDVMEQTKLMQCVFPGLKRPPTNTFINNMWINMSRIFLYSTEQVIRGIAEHLGLAKATADYWIVCSRLHSGFSQILSMKSEQVMNILESIDAFRQDERFYSALAVVQGKNLKIAAVWLECVTTGANIKTIPKPNQDWKEIKQEIRDKRKAIIEKALQRYEEPVSFGFHSGV